MPLSDFDHDLSIDFSDYGSSGAQLPPLQKSWKAHLVKYFDEKKLNKLSSIPSGFLLSEICTCTVSKNTIC